MTENKNESLFYAMQYQLTKGFIFILIFVATIEKQRISYDFKNINTVILP